MFLEKINEPRDLKKLSIAELNILCKEVRDFMVEAVSYTGGHLASSLGAIELTVALHYCLNTPKDVIVWDVGHQAYAHKILTQRKDKFKTLRQFGGLSGFPCKDESCYDSFSTGHSSTAVSLALGLSVANNSKVVAVMGDGSLSGGLCFEGLNQAGHLKKDLLVILNSNELSISPSVGALSTYLNKIISTPIYNRLRQATEDFMSSRLPHLGKRFLSLANKFEEGLKGLFIPGIFFEELGFRYYGPLDGHNLEILLPTLKNILTFKGPILLHVVTKKGKGYKPAEEDPVRFHSIGAFDKETGSPKITSNIPTYTEIFGKKILELAKKDRKIIAISAAMCVGTGLDKFAKEIPDRFFDVGIAEEHAICFAAGLSRRGLKPLVAIYSTFLQRAYDQIIEELALQNLPCVLAIDRAGISGEDGITHQGLFDIAYLRHIPGITLMAASSGQELEKMLEFSFSCQGPVAIRWPKDKVFDYTSTTPEIKLGKAEVISEGRDIAIISLGSMLKNVISAKGILEKEGISATIVNARFTKPLDQDLLKALANKFKYIFSVEDGILEGGFGSGIQEALNKPIIRLGLESKFITHGKRDLLLEKNNLDAQGIANTIKQCLNQK